MDRHHIVPKHMGGTDDPSNIVTLTREEHAEAHRLLYEQHGKHEDLWAWKFLSRSTNWEWLRGDNNPQKRPEVREKTAQTMREYHREHPNSADTRMKKRLSKLGEKNPAFGKSGFFDTANERMTCPHCGTTSNRGNIHRWHLNRCKSVGRV